MATKQQIVRMLRKKSPKSRRVGVVTNEGSLSPSEREAARRRIEEIKALESSLQLERKELPRDHRETLLKMARFVVDVHGDPAAIEKLKAAVEAVEKFQEIGDELSALRQEREKLSSRVNRRKYDAYEDGAMFRLIVASADTLDELAAKVRK